MNIFGKAETAKTVDGILSAFTSMVNDLEGVVAEQIEIRKKAEDEALDAQVRADAAKTEANRAVSAINKIQALLA